MSLTSMNMDALRKRILHTCDVPKDLDSVISIDAKSEVDPRSVGMTKADVDFIWDRIIDLYKTGAHPGMTVAIRRQGEILMSRSIGHAQGNGPKDGAGSQKVLATPDTPFCLYSLSKAITAVLMHMLAEDGLINLMDPVSYYAPEFAQNGKENINIHQILAHRGGIPGLPRDESLDVLLDEEQSWQLMCESEPITTDGSKLAYHAITGGLVLGRVMRNVTGGDFNAYVDKKIRQPMGMKYFTYGVEPKYQADLAQSDLTGLPPGPLVTFMLKRSLGVNISELDGILNDPRAQQVVIPSVNLVSNAMEISNFFQMMLNGGKWGRRRICAASTVARAVQEFGNRTRDEVIGLPMRYSAGLMLGGEPGIWGPKSQHAYGHVGLINKFGWADPERELSVSLLNNGMPFISHHIPALVNVIRGVGNHVPRSNKLKPFSLSEAVSG